MTSVNQSFVDIIERDTESIRENFKALLSMKQDLELEVARLNAEINRCQREIKNKNSVIDSLRARLVATGMECVV